MKTVAILIPTYRRFQDLKRTLENTYINAWTKFIIVANLEDPELEYLEETYHSKSIIIDERPLGKLGGCKAYNLAYDVAREHNFDYAILYADDVMPFESNWLSRLYTDFIDKNMDFGIFSTDECHVGHYGWNIVLDCPIAHFFILKCQLVPKLFLDEYKQYAIDFEIALRLQAKGVDIHLLAIRLNHLRSGLHRELMDQTMTEDHETLTKAYPRYKESITKQENLFFLREQSKHTCLSDVNYQEMIYWPSLNEKSQNKVASLRRFTNSMMQVWKKAKARFRHKT